MYLNHYKKETFIIEKKMYADGKKNPKQKKKKEKGLIKIKIFHSILPP